MRQYRNSWRLVFDRSDVHPHTQQRAWYGSHLWPMHIPSVVDHRHRPFLFVLDSRFRFHFKIFCLFTVQDPTKLSDDIKYQWTDKSQWPMSFREGNFIAQTKTQFERGKERDQKNDRPKYWFSSFASSRWIPSLSHKVPLKIWSQDNECVYLYIYFCHCQISSWKGKLLV